MSLIPIGFKADDDNNAKKGKIRAEDFSALLAFSLQRKTGILDLLNKMNCSATVSGGVATVTIQSGYAAICGHPVYVEEGTTTTVELPSSSESGYFGIKVDLSAEEGDECKFFAKTGSLTQEDLNENPLDGVYEFALYSYSADNSSFTLTGKVADLITASGISQAALYTADETGTIDTTKTIKQKFESIETRLTELNFKDGSGYITFDSAVTATLTRVQRLGYFVIGKVMGVINAPFTDFEVLCTLPTGFTPKEQVSGYAGLEQYGGQGTSSVSAPFLINTAGEIKFSPAINSTGADFYNRSLRFSIIFGFAAEKSE